MGYGIKRHPQSMPGDFYVEQDCCLACGVPEVIAPDLVAHEKERYWHCYWKKQPETPDELDRAVKILHTQELDCHRYGGSDPAILERLPPECCDVVSAPRLKRTAETWNLASGPGVHFNLRSDRSFFGRIWRRILGDHRQVKQ